MTERKDGHAEDGNRSRELTPEESESWRRAFVVAYEIDGKDACEYGEYEPSRARIKFREDYATYEMIAEPSDIDTSFRPKKITTYFYRNGALVQKIISSSSYDENDLPIIDSVQNVPIGSFNIDDGLSIQEAADYSSRLIVGKAEANRVAHTVVQGIGYGDGVGDAITTSRMPYIPPSSEYQN